MARGRRREAYGEFWPAYVDVLSTLLMVFTLLLSIFMLAQFYVSQDSSGKDNALRRLTRQIAELTSLLSLEQGKTKSAQDEFAALQASLASLQAENARLLGSAGLGDDKAAKAEFERLQVLAEHASAAWERAVFGTVYKTIFEPILPSVLVKFIDLDSLEPDQELMWTSRVLMIQRRSGAETTGALAEMVSTLSSEDHISINFLDVRGRDPTGRLLGCAIAIEHTPGLFKHVDDALNKAAGIHRPDGE